MAAAYLTEAGACVRHAPWQHGDSRQPLAEDWSGDWIVGFKADYVFRPPELAKARVGAVNFHPAPPNFRGIGGYEAAAREAWPRFGVTCHHMIREIDAGPIIEVVQFRLPAGLTIQGIRELAAAHLYAMLVELGSVLVSGRPLPASPVQWSGPLHTRSYAPPASPWR
jgi:methionyl-tRNA formyltransferase